MTALAKKKLEPVRIALRPREAALALAISEKTLWTMTAPRGPIPCVRLGSRVIYRISDLQEWLSKSKTLPGG